MIQRKQTLFLLVVIIASALMFFFPLAKFYGNGMKDVLTLNIYSVKSMVTHRTLPNSLSLILPLLAGNIFVIVFSFVSIFLFKNRKRQMHIIRLNILVEVLFLGLFFFYYVSTLEKNSGGPATYEAGIFMPLVALVFLVLAYFGVLHDERLVRSADRLR